MMLTFSPIGEGFAAEASGVDCGRPLSPQTVSAVEDTMARYAVLVFRDQPLDDEAQLAFTRHFGEIEKKGRGTAQGAIHFRTGTQVRGLVARARGLLQRGR